MAGRPVGSETKNKRFKAALNRLIDADPRRLDELAEKWWALAMEGDVQAITSIADRLDGKPAQAHIGGEDDEPPIRLEKIERVIVNAPNTDGEGVPATTGPGEI